VGEGGWEVGSVFGFVFRPSAVLVGVGRGCVIDIEGVGDAEGDGVAVMSK
jgi:hypothetical protein